MKDAKAIEPITDFVTGEPLDEKKISDGYAKLASVNGEALKSALSSPMPNVPD
jgi:hypothetical protein